MKYTYKIHGMSCSGCVTHVEQALSNAEGVSSVAVDLKKAEAMIEMKSHVPLKKLQDALKNSGGNYSITLPGEDIHDYDDKMHASTHKETPKSADVFYCPMHCEGDKTYDKQGNCPVCGMDLVQQPSSQKTKQQYTCQCIRKLSGMNQGHVQYVEWSLFL